eukprot:2829411-Prymnesium_polylepis.1
MHVRDAGAQERTDWRGSAMRVGWSGDVCTVRSSLCVGDGVPAPCALGGRVTRARCALRCVSETACPPCDRPPAVCTCTVLHMQASIYARHWLAIGPPGRKPLCIERREAEGGHRGIAPRASASTIIAIKF